jgi:hypothetical protein
MPDATAVHMKRLLSIVCVSFMLGSCASSPTEPSIELTVRVRDANTYAGIVAEVTIDGYGYQLHVVRVTTMTGEATFAVPSSRGLIVSVTAIAYRATQRALYGLTAGSTIDVLLEK